MKFCQQFALFLLSTIVAVAVSQQTPAPTSSEAPSGVPSAEPTLSAEPSVSPPPTGDKSMCMNNERCAALELTGMCCPTIDDWTLDCCDSAPPIEETCERNPECSALTLTGACCPTIDPDFGYLDCCTVFPPECLDGESDDCTVSNSTTYLEAINQQASGARTTTTGTLFIASVLAFVLAGVVSLY